jgi:MFS family permease
MGARTPPEPGYPRGAPAPSSTCPQEPAAALVDVHLYGWRHRTVLAAAVLAIASGFAQFGVTAALADVARVFGAAGPGPSLAEQVGLSLTTLGLGLGVIRFASLASMPLAALADRVGRRRVILGCCLIGLALTVVAAGSPTFWWFVALFAIGRPLLSATNALAGVIAAEETRAADRAKAIALIAAAYGFGAALIAVIRGVSGLGFRPLFMLAAVPLVLVVFVGRWLEEPDRYARLCGTNTGALTQTPRPWRIAPALRGRLALLAGLGFAIAFVTGPVTTLVFLYGENVLGLTPSISAVIVIAGAPLGLSGLVAGRWAADRLGRVPTAMVAHAGIAVAGAIAYTASMPGAIGGYLACWFAQAAAGPAIGSLAAELFPTSSRATAAGWLNAAGVLGAVGGLVTFGLLADAFGSFGPAALAVTIPMGLASAGYLFLPETRGLELEESAPEPDQSPPWAPAE